MVAHLAGSDVDFLLFDYPLTGTFEFSVEAFDGPWAESALTHNGLLLEPSSFQGNSQISQVGALQSVNLPSRLSRRDGFNTMTVQVSPRARSVPGERPSLLRGRGPRPDGTVAGPLHASRPPRGVARSHALGRADDSAGAEAVRGKPARRLDRLVL